MSDPMRSMARTALLLVLAVAGAWSTVAAERGPDGWNERIREVERLLQETSYEPAFVRARALADELADRLGSGESADRAMGTAVAQLALAEAGLGRLEDAAWHWSVALSFRPDLGDVALGESYGDAGAALEARRDAWEWSAAAQEAPPADAGSADRPVVIRRTRAKEGLEPPRKLSSPAPQSTAAMRRLAIADEVVLQMSIEADGSLRRPRILQQRFPGWAFVVSETVRRWRFEPARQDGEPVATPYLLTIDWGP